MMHCKMAAHNWTHSTMDGHDRIHSTMDIIWYILKRMHTTGNTLQWMYKMWCILKYLHTIGHIIQWLYTIWFIQKWMHRIGHILQWMYGIWYILKWMHTKGHILQWMYTIGYIIQWFISAKSFSWHYFAMFFNLIYHFYLSYRKNTAIYVDLTPPHLNLIVCYTCILHLRIALPCRNWWCKECSKITKVRFPYIKRKVCKSNLIIF